MPDKQNAGQDLRSWIKDVETINELRRVDGAHWNLEIGAITELNNIKRGPTLLFDSITDYAPGFRVLTSALGNARRVALTFNLGADHDDQSLVGALQGKPLQWESISAEMQPRIVTTGPIMEIEETGSQVDLWKFPSPKWHEHDGGRYLGTGCAVIIGDPDSEFVNLGAYRCMVVDRNKLSIHISPGKHGRILMEEWFEKEGRAPVAVSLGHHPLLMAVAGIEIPAGVSEYHYAGAILNDSIEVIKGPVTGLPLPAAAEIVLEGYCYPDRRAPEGPFGEWTGYYSYTERPVPYLTVEAVYHRPDPIILGASPGLPPHDYSYFRTVLKSALIHDALVKSGVPGVEGVWAHECGGGRQLIAVSIRTNYCGHSRQVGLLASSLPASAYMGKFVVIVDDDIDPTNLEQVLWAMCTRCDPSEDIDIIKKAWGSRLDPLLTEKKAPYNSRAIIDATIPFERKNDFPVVARSDHSYLEQIGMKWASLWS